MKNRPIHLNLWTIHFPIPAIVSILHRLSGLFLCMLIPTLLLALQASLGSPQRFEQLRLFFNRFETQFFLWLFIAALGFHFLAGIRHLLMDMHIGDSKRAAHFSAWLTIVLAMSVMIVGSYWVWWK